MVDSWILVMVRISEALERLPVRDFVRIHRSYVVALGKIDRVERYQVTISDQVLPVSAGFWEGLLNRLFPL